MDVKWFITQGEAQSCTHWHGVICVCLCVHFTSVNQASAKIHNGDHENMNDVLQIHSVIMCHTGLLNIKG